MQWTWKILRCRSCYSLPFPSPLAPFLASFGGFRPRFLPSLPVFSAPNMQYPPACRPIAAELTEYTKLQAWLRVRLALTASFGARCKDIALRRQTAVGMATTREGMWDGANVLAIQRASGRQSTPTRCKKRHVAWISDAQHSVRLRKFASTAVPFLEASEPESVSYAAQLVSPPGPTFLRGPLAQGTRELLSAGRGRADQNS
jgi:hypothetical protein